VEDGIKATNASEASACGASAAAQKIVGTLAPLMFLYLSELSIRKETIKLGQLPFYRPALLEQEYYDKFFNAIRNQSRNSFSTLLIVQLKVCGISLTLTFKLVSHSTRL
jgi:hypothetical protein